MTRLGLLLALTTALLLGVFAPVARADGDPGSDVLVYQNLFVPADANVPVREQVRLGGLLRSAAQSGFPIRVAVIAKSDDLGAVTALWGKPAAYARFLGIELSLAYKQRLLVVMPNGFGFNWPGHSSAAASRPLAGVHIRSGGTGLAEAAEAAVQRLAQASGVKLALPASGKAGASTPADRGGAAAAPPTAPAKPANSPAPTVLAVVLATAAAGSMALWLALRARRRGSSGGASERPGAGKAPPRRVRRAIPGAALLLGSGVGALGITALIIALGAAAGRAGAPGAPENEALAGNPNVDPGTSLSGTAPSFTLTDQFGQAVSLRQFRGKVVILGFSDSECTSICPLTTSAMLQAKAMLGAAGSQVQLLGVDANPKATAVEDVLSYSELHGLLHQWHFLTGSTSQLERVWRAYGVAAQVQAGVITHTQAVFLIDPRGRERKLYMTQQAYSAVGQFGQALAQEASRLLPGHPPVRSSLSEAQIAAISPDRGVTLPRAGGGTVRLGPGSPRLVVFFATWDRGVTGLAGQLEALSRYQSWAARTGLPKLTAVDEGSVEPSRTALAGFLRDLPRPLSYPVAIDQTGRLSDGYHVQGQPWFALTSAQGQILWQWDVSTSGWPSRAALIRHVRDALAHTTAAGASAASSTAPDATGARSP